MSMIISDPNIESESVRIGRVIDHLVDALGGDPGCTLRRAVILADIDEFPGTTQAGIIQRLEADKSALNRDIEWFYDYGCIMRQDGRNGREIGLHTCGYAKKNLELALAHFNNSHRNLKTFLITYMNFFGQHKSTLRDAKIVATLGDKGSANRQAVFEELYNGPLSTDNRAINNLIVAGILKKKGDDNV